MKVLHALLKYVFNNKEDDNKTIKDISLQQEQDSYIDTNKQQTQQQPTSSAQSIEGLGNYIDLRLGDDDDDDNINYSTRRRHSNANLRRKRMNMERGMDQRCLDCRVRFKYNHKSLHNPSKRGFCIGCDRLERVAHSKEDEEDMRRWLCTGDLSVKEWETRALPSLMTIKPGSRAKYFKRRFRKRLNSNSSTEIIEPEFPSSEAIDSLYIDGEYKCAVTGWLCPFTKCRGRSFWAATLDHVVPISAAPNNMNTWSIDNIQIVSYVINKIKGDHTEEDIRNWYKHWLDANQ